MNNGIVALLALVEVISIILVAKRYGKSENIALLELGIGTLFCLAPLMWYVAVNFSTNSSNGIAADPLFWFVIVNGGLVALAIYVMRIFYTQQQEVRIHA